MNESGSVLAMNRKSDRQFTYNRCLMRMSGATFLSNEIRCALLGHGYSPDRNHESWKDVAAHEIRARGYIAGGRLLIGKSIISNSKGLAFAASSPKWPRSQDLDARYAVFYDRTSGALIAGVDLGEHRATSNSSEIEIDTENGIIRFERFVVSVGRPS